MPRHKHRRKPTQLELRMIHGRFGLGEFFDKEAIEDLMSLARRRIIGVFHHATERRLRRASSAEYAHNKAVGLERKYWHEVGTDNYIIGVSHRQLDLSHYIQSKIKSHIVSWRNLPGSVRLLLEGLPDVLVQRFLACVEQKVILLQLNTMCHLEIWYDEARGIWQMSQSTVDEFRRLRRVARQQFKVDRRNEHGMVRAQRKNRQRPAGVSVSWQPAS